MTFVIKLEKLSNNTQFLDSLDLSTLNDRLTNNLWSIDIAPGHTIGQFGIRQFNW